MVHFVGASSFRAAIDASPRNFQRKIFRIQTSVGGLSINPATKKNYQSIQKNEDKLILWHDLINNTVPPTTATVGTLFSTTAAFDSPRTASPDRSNSIHKTNQHHRHTQKIENIGHPHYSSKKVIIHKKEKEQQNLARFEANSPVFDP